MQMLAILIFANIRENSTSSLLLQQILGDRLDNMHNFQQQIVVVQRRQIIDVSFRYDDNVVFVIRLRALIGQDILRFANLLYRSFAGQDIVAMFVVTASDALVWFGVFFTHGDIVSWLKKELFNLQANLS